MHPMSTTFRASKLPFHRLAFFGHSANDVYWFILPVILPPMIADYGLNYAAAGGVLSLYLLVVAVFSILSGRLSDSFFPTRLIGLGFVGASVGFLFASASSTLPLLNLSLAVAAVGVSVFHPAIYGMADSHVSEKRGRFFGRFESYGSGSVIVMLVLSSLLLQHYSWRIMLALAALPGVVAAFLYLREPRRGAPRAQASDDGLDSSLSPWHFGLFLLSSLWRFVSVMAVLSFVPTFLAYRGDLPLGASELVTGAYFLGGFVGARALGRLADRTNPLGLYLGIVAVIAPLIFLLSSVEGAALSAAVLFFFGGAAIGCIPLQNLLMRRFRSSLQAGHAFGVLLGVMTVAQALSPFLFGLSADRLGLRQSIRLFSVPAVAAAVIILFLYLVVSRRRSQSLTA